MRLAMLLVMLAVMGTLLLVGPKLGGCWEGHLIDEASGGWSDVAVRLTIDKSEPALARLSGSIIYFRPGPAIAKRGMIDREISLSGTWDKEGNQIKLEWAEEDGHYSFHCRLARLLTDLLICFGARTAPGQVRAHSLKLHRPRGGLRR
jgi:hypothetical protein